MPGTFIPLAVSRSVPLRPISPDLERVWRAIGAVAERGGMDHAGDAAASDVPERTTSPDEIRVLLVDDNLATLARVSTALAPGCDIVGAMRDGPSALAAARDLSPDVIVLDISMPGMNGFELARRLRQLGSAAALVFLTVHDEQEFIMAARDVGALGYVEKPRLAIDLLHAVREARAGRSFFAA
jgi:CheY-like chemotaxis protein